MKVADNVVTSTGWSGRLGALKSRAVPDDDPRVLECRRAMAFWRVKRAVDKELDTLGPGGVTATTELLHDLVFEAAT